MSISSSLNQSSSSTPIKFNANNGKAESKRCNYKDWSNVMPPDGYVQPTKIADMNFAEKLHHILSRSDLESIIEWR